MDLKACIFDLDGVLVDTARYHFLAWQRLAAGVGIHFDETLNEELKGISRMRSLELILERAGVAKTEQEKETMARDKNSWFVEMVNQMSPDEILPGVVELLDALDEEGVQLAVGSASKNARLALTQVGLIERFETIVDGTMVQKAKPDPEVFLTAAGILEVPPESCVVFEDAAAGVEAALRGGMKCIGLGKEENLGSAHRVIQSMKEVTVSDLRRL